MTTDGGLGSGTWADFLHPVAIIPAKTTARSNARVLNRLVGRDCVFIDLVEFSEYGFGEDLAVCAGQIERAGIHWPQIFFPNEFAVRRVEAEQAFGCEEGNDSLAVRRRR